jgi:hypothetical protein
MFYYKPYFLKLVDIIVNLEKKFLLFLILFLLGFLQFHYLQNFTFSLYFASTDYLDSANIMFNLNWPLISNNTANARSWFYPLMLTISGSGNPNFSQIINIQMLFACFLPSFFFIILINMRQEVKFSFLFCLVLCLSCCFLVFSRTILNEFPYILLISFFCILSLIFLTSSRRFFLFLLMLMIVFCLIGTRPTGVVFGISLILFLIFYFYHNHIGLKFLISSIMCIIFVIIISLSLNKILNPNYGSNSFIFSTINIIPYLGNSNLSQIEFDPINIKSHKQILQLMSDYENTERGAKGWKKNVKKLNLKIDESTCEFKGTNLSSCFLAYANLESYWQAKWLYIGKFGMKEANSQLNKFSMETIKNDPLGYAKILSKNFFWHIIGSGGGKHISYKINKDGPFLKNANKVRFYSTHKYDDSKIVDHPITLKTMEKLLGNDFKKQLNHINKKVKKDNLKTVFTNFNKYFNFFFNIFWLLGQISGIILLTIFSLNLFKYNFFKNFYNELLVGSFLYISLVFHMVLVSYGHPPLGRYLIPLLPIHLTLIVIISRIILIKYK